MDLYIVVKKIKKPQTFIQIDFKDPSPNKENYIAQNWGKQRQRKAVFKMVNLCLILGVSKIRQKVIKLVIKLISKT